MDGTLENHMNIERFCEVWARIFGRLDGVEYTATIRPKDATPDQPLAG